MAAGFVKSGIEAILNKEIDLDTDTIKVALMLDTHTFVSTNVDIADISADILTNGRSGALTSPSITDGIFDAADPSITPDTSQTFDALYIYHDSGVDSTSKLIWFTDVIANTPFTTTGAALTIVWDDGANKIFKIPTL